MSDDLLLELCIWPFLPLWRKSVVAVTVLVLDLAVLAMNYQLRLLILRDFPGTIHGVLLAVKNLRITLSSCAPDGPAIFTGHHMLIAFSHIEVPYCGVIAVIYVCGR